MRFVICELKKDPCSGLELTGFELTIIITELMALEHILEKYFYKLIGLSNLQKAMRESHIMMNKNKSAADTFDDKIIVGIPKQLITHIFDDLVFLKTAFEESGREKIINYEDTFNKLVILKREIIKLSDINHKLYRVPAELLKDCKQTDINLN